MKIITYNVNGVRAALKKGLADWIQKEDPDIICLQEIKVDEANAPKEIFHQLGYHQVWHSAQKKGYSGVATFSKQKPTDFGFGMNTDKFDFEGRVLRTEINGVHIYNCYFPSGSSGEERHQFKMEFLKDFQPWIENELKIRKKLIVVGDYNIVHQGMDIHNPKRKDNPSGYRPEERAWLDHWFKNHFTDAFRLMNPEKIEFSWWTYRLNTRAKNKGWRIDYISVSDNLKTNISSSGHLSDAFHSDHCPVFTNLKL